MGQNNKWCDACIRPEKTLNPAAASYCIFPSKPAWVAMDQGSTVLQVWHSCSCCRAASHACTLKCCGRVRGSRTSRIQISMNLLGQLTAKKGHALLVQCVCSLHQTHMVFKLPVSGILFPFWCIRSRSEARPSLALNRSTIGLPSNDSKDDSAHFRGG